MKENKFLASLVRTFFILLASLFLTLLSFLATDENISKTLFLGYFSQVQVFFINYLLVLTLVLIFSFLTRRIDLGFFISFVLILVLGLANVTKLNYRLQMLRLSDLFLLGEAEQMTEAGYKLVLFRFFWLALGAGLILSLIFFLSSFKKASSRKVLGIFAALSLALSIFFVQGRTFESYLNPKFNPWLQVEREKGFGLVYNFFRTYRELTIPKPDAYDPTFARQSFQTYPDQDLGADEKIHMIFIMLESYNDFDKLGVDFEIDPYEDMEYLRNDSISGRLYVPVFGGGTVWSERSFITSSHGQPYRFKKRNSLAHYLKGQGYTSVAMHPNTWKFYDRLNFNKNLGFEYFYADENLFGDLKGTDPYLKDEKLLPLIYKDFKEKSKAGPYFNFTVSIQNHGPYPSGKSQVEYLKYDRPYKQEDFNSINHYFHGIKATSQELTKFLKSFEAEEPTLFIIFGDHNPSLGENNSAFAYMGLDIESESLEAYKNKYTTPYYIHGNQALKALWGKDFVGQGPNLSTEFLLAYAFDYLGLGGPSIIRVQNNIFPGLEAYNDSVIQVDNDLCFIENYPDQDLVNSYRSIEYYYNKNFLYH